MAIIVKQWKETLDEGTIYERETYRAVLEFYFFSAPRYFMIDMNKTFDSGNEAMAIEYSILTQKPYVNRWSKWRYVPEEINEEYFKKAMESFILYIETNKYEIFTYTT